MPQNGLWITGNDYGQSTRHQALLSGRQQWVQIFWQYEYADEVTVKRAEDCAAARHPSVARTLYLTLGALIYHADVDYSGHSGFLLSPL